MRQREVQRRQGREIRTETKGGTESESERFKEREREG